MYVEALFRPKSLENQVIYPEDARRIIIKALDQDTTVSPLLYSRDSTGKTIGRHIGRYPAAVPVIYGGGNGFIRVYGIGDEGKEVLLKDLTKIYTALSSSLDTPVAMEMRSGKISYSVKGYRSYRINRFALVKSARPKGDTFFGLMKRSMESKTDEEKDAAFREALPLIMSALDFWLASIAEQFGLDLPRNLDIQITGGSLGAQRIHPDRPGHVGIVRNLTFNMLGDLTGPWAIGHLRSHGCGMIRREIREAAA